MNQHCTASLIALDLPVPPMLETALGYDGPARWVGFFWAPYGDEPRWTDGRREMPADWYAWRLFSEHLTIMAALAPYRPRLKRELGRARAAAGPRRPAALRRAQGDSAGIPACPVDSAGRAARSRAAAGRRIGRSDRRGRRVPSDGAAARSGGAGGRAHAAGGCQRRGAASLAIRAIAEDGRELPPLIFPAQIAPAEGRSEGAIVAAEMVQVQGRHWWVGEDAAALGSPRAPLPYHWDRPLIENAEALIDNLQADYGKGNDLDYLLLGGGGALVEAKAAAIQRSYPFALVVDDPQFAIARGYARLGRRFMRAQM